jgi:hypothetical protein
LGWYGQADIHSEPLGSSRPVRANLSTHRRFNPSCQEFTALITNNCQTRTTLALMVFLSIPAVTHAETASYSGDVRLKDVSRLAIVIEPLADAAKQCGISVDGLDAAVRLPLSVAAQTGNGYTVAAGQLDLRQRHRGEAE